MNWLKAVALVLLASIAWGALGSFLELPTVVNFLAGMAIGFMAMSWAIVHWNLI